MPIVRERWAPVLSPSSVAGILLCLVAVVFGSSRDFGVFLLALVALPVLAILVAALVTVDLLQKQRVGAAMGAALLIASLAIYWGSGVLRDRIRFAFWATTHPTILFNPGSTRIVGSWDGWGMAGSENDSYLAVDQRRGLGTLSGNNVWRNSVSQRCDIADVQKVWPTIYIVTTYNCPFDGFPLL